MTSHLRVGYGTHVVILYAKEITYVENTVREHFSSPILQFAEVDAGQTFTLVECPSMKLSLTSHTIQSLHNLCFRWNWTVDFPAGG